MSQTSGDAADRMLKLMIDGVEVLVKLSGKGAMHSAAAIYAAIKDNKQFKGATNLKKLLKTGKDVKIFRLEEKDLDTFKTQAKKYGILFSAIRDEQADDGYCDIFVKTHDISRVNHVLARMGYNEIPLAEEEINIQDQEMQYEQTPKKDSQQRNNSNTQSFSSKHREEHNVDIEQVIKDFKANKKDSLTTENLKAYLAINSNLYGYSEKNKEKIFEQNPSASVVMSRTKWRELGRNPKQGAEGLVIKMPSTDEQGRTTFVDAAVYDISETYGEDISKSKFITTLENGSTEMKSEIERLKVDAPVKIVVNNDFETDCFYSPEDKTIYLQADIPDDRIYKGMVRETQYANDHIKQGKEYSRTKNMLVAESVAYSMAYKYGVDTRDFRFDCIPDVVNGLDGKDVGELINFATTASAKEIKKAESNIALFKPNEKRSVKNDLNNNRKSIDNKTYRTPSTTKVEKLPIKEKVK